jgi:hypothetical protein
LAGRRPPNLDLVLESGTGVIGVESKCLEYFSSKDADFADAYEAEIKDERRDGPWFAHMQALRSAPDLYRSLDAAQLIKHAFGLAHTFAGQNVHLLYLFWEPRNADDFGHFRAHRDEAAHFAAAVSGGTPTFSFATYDELWRQWERPAPPPWLKTKSHVCARATISTSETFRPAEHSRVSFFATADLSLCSSKLFRFPIANPRGARSRFALETASVARCERGRGFAALCTAAGRTDPLHSAAALTGPAALQRACAKRTPAGSALREHGLIAGAIMLRRLGSFGGSYVQAVCRSRCVFEGNGDFGHQ